MTRVLLVDDQDLVRAGFKTILQSEPGIEVVGEAANGADAVERARELQPDVICMDVQMPGMDGLEATRMLVADASVTAGVLILTTFDRDDYLFEALQAGASGFLLKNARAEELIDAVTIVARGDALLSPTVTRRVISRFAAEAPAAAAPPAKPVDTDAVRDLTDRELEVLKLMAAGLSNSEIAGRLYVGEATVKTHVSKVLMKLGLRDRIQAVIFAYEHGLAG
ncbi:response regulator transcription factor [Salinibacterium sp. dk2585]|uniref:response regulator n=1 Tax=unclassified Salinibacterium TaxID=2632331 RepID=UPI0011C252DF|nr:MULTISPECIES: response regulator transcription factor [unclassified Salinibacterium]QEE60292.1 response regulator transcription factor [Salinibacterium sp. dk2585]TXK55364.1 response regulator transcription factor [Salinibacterium sp. dk5596]